MAKNNENAAKILDYWFALDFYRKTNIQIMWK